MYALIKATSELVSTAALVLTLKGEHKSATALDSRYRARQPSIPHTHTHTHTHSTGDATSRLPEIESRPVRR